MTLELEKSDGVARFESQHYKPSLASLGLVLVAPTLPPKYHQDTFMVLQNLSTVTSLHPHTDLPAWLVRYDQGWPLGSLNNAWDAPSQNDNNHT